MSMDDFADTLWQEFANETEEHLGLVEPILARAGPETASSDDIAQLFRSFHSIKGLARAMDLRGMEAVAHRAEDILGVVRDGRAVLAGHVVDGLLQAVDALGQLRVKVLAKRKNMTAPKPLIRKLDDLFAEMGGGAAPEPAAAPAEEAPAARTGPAFHDNMEMVAIFVEMMRDRLAELALILSPAIADPAVRAQTQDAASSLAHGAAVMGFEQLGDNLAAIEALLPAADGTMLDADRRLQAIRLLSSLSMQAKALAELSQQDAGLGKLAAALADVVGDDGLAQIAGVNELLDRMAADGAAAPVAADLARAGGHLHAILHGLGLARADRLALLIDSVFAGIAGGGADVTGALIAATRAAIEALVPVFQAAGPGRDVAENDEARLTEAMHTALDTGEAAAAADQLALSVRPELREILSPENLGELHEALADGQHLYELLVDFEAEPSVASALLAWLSDGVRAVTNRTILKDGVSWFEFLLLTPLEPTAFKDKLLDIDAELACIKAARRVTDTADGEMLLGEADAAESGAPAPAAAAADGQVQQGPMVLRVSGETIDRFMTQIGETRIVATALTQLIDDGGLGEALAALRRLAARLPADAGEELGQQIQKLDEHQRQLRQADQRIDGALARLHAGALDLRVVPIDTILNRFPRVVRDLAQAIGKQIQLKLEGRDVKVDKSTVQLLGDPLMHMVRNSADHGIEPPEERVARGKPEMATILMRAAQRGNEVTVEVSDDGRGLNTEAIRRKAVARGLIGEEASRRLPQDEICRFILQPGFSTAEKVTETSGRGVGMDVVHASVLRLGGEIEIRTRPGKGATFILHLPLSAALQTALIVEVGGQNLAIPDRAVAAVEEVLADSIRLVGHQRTVLRHGQLMPIYRLGQLLRLSDRAAAPRTSFPMVVVASGPHAIGIEVDRLRRRQELFLKDLHPKLAAFPAIGGASVMGDGRVVLVLDADGLIQLARRGTTGAATASQAAS
jgi:chemotaxis protein histidine kinase CheA